VTLTARDHRPARSRTVFAAAALLALAVALLAPSLVAAAAAPALSVSGDTLTVRVLGGERTGVWRARIVATGGTERIDFVLSSGDLTFSAVVRTSTKTADGWRVTHRQRVPGTFRGLESATGSGAGVSWDSDDFRLPADGDGRFVVRVELLRDGAYWATSAVRHAEEAFVYGPWQRIAADSVSH
jgi:hypothetical protein